MNITDYLDQSLIIAEFGAGDADSVLHQFAECIHRRHPGISASEVYRTLKEREALGSTGIGEGIAIPHGKMKQLDHIIAAFGRSRAGIDFDAIDGRPVTLFFLLLAPENSAGLHLKALAKISRMLKDEDFRRRLAAADNGEDLYAEIRAADQAT
ncbi:MAG: PTS sugar transporter subunit IIA [Deltaproteobacteria bacterium]|nr:PTS sugar transporter subunit IIA [Candidatus Anaeroferrophillacea bacterium]